MSEEKTPSKLLKLPKDLLKHVFVTLSPKDHCEAAPTSSAINELSNDPNYWNYFLKKAYRSDYTGEAKRIFLTNPAARKPEYLLADRRGRNYVLAEVNAGRWNSVILKIIKKEALDLQEEKDYAEEIKQARENLQKLYEGGDEVKLTSMEGVGRHLSILIARGYLTVEKISSLQPNNIRNLNDPLLLAFILSGDLTMQQAIDFSRIHLNILQDNPEILTFLEDDLIKMKYFLQWPDCMEFFIRDPQIFELISEGYMSSKDLVNVKWEDQITLSDPRFLNFMRRNSLNVTKILKFNRTIIHLLLEEQLSYEEADTLSVTFMEQLNELSSYMCPHQGLTFLDVIDLPPEIREDLQNQQIKFYTLSYPPKITGKTVTELSAQQRDNLKSKALQSKFKCFELDIKQVIELSPAEREQYEAEYRQEEQNQKTINFRDTYVDRLLRDPRLPEFLKRSSLKVKQLLKFDPIIVNFLLTGQISDEVANNVSPESLEKFKKLSLYIFNSGLTFHDAMRLPPEIMKDLQNEQFKRYILLWVNTITWERVFTLTTEARDNLKSTVLEIKFKNLELDIEEVMALSVDEREQYEAEYAQEIKNSEAKESKTEDLSGGDSNSVFENSNFLRAEQYATETMREIQNSEAKEHKFEESSNKAFYLQDGLWYSTEGPDLIPATFETQSNAAEDSAAHFVSENSSSSTISTRVPLPYSAQAEEFRFFSQPSGHLSLPTLRLPIDENEDTASEVSSSPRNAQEEKRGGMSQNSSGPTPTQVYPAVRQLGIFPNPGGAVAPCVSIHLPGSASISKNELDTSDDDGPVVPQKG